MAKRNLRSNRRKKLASRRQTARTLAPPAPAAASSPVSPQTGAIGFNSLPWELRSMIWTEALGPTPRTEADMGIAGTERVWYADDRGTELARGTVSRLYSRQISPVTQICHESRQLALSHLCISKARQKEARRRWETENHLVEISNITRAAAKNGELRPLLDEHETLVLNLQSIVHCHKSLPAYLLDFILAARDNQIKIRPLEDLIITVEHGPKRRSQPYENWVRGHARLVDINDTGVIRELAMLHKRTKDHRVVPADVLLELDGNPVGREEFVASILRPVQRLWQETSTRRAKARMPGLRPLPKIDVVLPVFVVMSTDFRRHAVGVANPGPLPAYENDHCYG